MNEEGRKSHVWPRWGGDNQKRPRFEQNEKTRLHFKLETSLFSVEILEPCLITATDWSDKVLIKSTSVVLTGSHNKPDSL